MIRTNPPPRFLRALFIAAFATAGRADAAFNPAPIAPLTQYRAERRDRSVAHVARHLGRPLLAAGRADAAFGARGALYAVPEPEAPPLDPIAAVLTSCTALDAAIGRPGLSPEHDDAWIEVRRDAATPHVKLFWRGEFIQGERMARVWKEEDGVRRIAHGDGETVGSSRRLDMDRMIAALDAARTALRRSGIALSSFYEAKRVNTPVFKGAIATIGLARERPLYAQQRGPVLVR